MPAIYINLGDEEILKEIQKFIPPDLISKIINVEICLHVEENKNALYTTKSKFLSRIGEIFKIEPLIISTAQKEIVKNPHFVIPANCIFPSICVFGME
jgi:hypothetical protein